MMRTLNEEEQHKDLTNPRRYPTEDSQNSFKKRKSLQVLHKESTQEENKERCIKPQ